MDNGSVGETPTGRFGETLVDVVWNLANWERKQAEATHTAGYEYVDLFPDSRDRVQYCIALAEKFEASHPDPFGEGYYPKAGDRIALGDEFGDDYILSIDAFCEREFKEFDTRNSDSLDFSEQGRRTLRLALEGRPCPSHCPDRDQCRS